MNIKGKEILLIFSCVFAIIVMFITKYPFIDVPYSEHFCEKWNDIWFGLSCSYIVAFFMYYFTDFKPKKEFSHKVKPILKQKLIFMHQTYNYVFEQFGGRGDFEKTDDDDLGKIMKNIWGDKKKDSDYTYREIVQSTLIELRQITTEVLSYHRCLDEKQIICLEEIVNMTYSGIKTAKKCISDSKDMQESFITGKILANWRQLFEKDNFVNDVFVPSYRKVLELEKSFE